MAAEQPRNPLLEMDRRRQPKGNAEAQQRDEATIPADAPRADEVQVAERCIEETVGRKVSIQLLDDTIPDADWRDWILKTGLNSLATKDSWSFLERSMYNRRKVEAWEERGINTIAVGVHPDPTNNGHDDPKSVCEVLWDKGTDLVKVLWCPRARLWSSDVAWNDATDPAAAASASASHKRWWNIADELVFGLEVYRLPGKCLFKSDWVDDFEDVDPQGPFESSVTSFRRWLQFRHWTLFWYPRATAGWNHQWSTVPPKQADGSDFNLEAVRACLTLPLEGDQLPKIDLPDSEKIHLPTTSADGQPQESQPTDAAGPPVPEEGGTTDEEREAEKERIEKEKAEEEKQEKARAKAEKERVAALDKRSMYPKNNYCPHGMIEVAGLHATAKGNRLILSNARVLHFWEQPDGKIEVEIRCGERLDLRCVDVEQANSWVDTLAASGAQNDDAGSCCNVA